MASNKSNSVQINYAIDRFNLEYNHSLNGSKLSFTGSIKRGYQLYFKEADSGLIECTISNGSCKESLDSIRTLYQYFGAPKNFRKNNFK
jgi:hypothetical protein